MTLQDYLNRLLAGTSKAELLALVPHPVLVEMDAEEAVPGGSEAGTVQWRSEQAVRRSLGSNAARVVSLGPDPELRVGRAADVELRIDHPSISKEHARLRRSEGEGLGIEVEDLGSRNGTFVNGQRLPARAARALRPDDALTFGQTTGFQVLDPEGFYQYLQLLLRFGF